jgi:FlaA1/EpsC-like NDP-sugar epimerase
MRIQSRYPAAILADAVLVFVAWWLAFWLRFNLDLPDDFEAMALDTSWLAVAAYAAGLALTGVYRHVWRFVGLPELRRLGWGLLVGALFCTAAVMMLRFANFPRSVLVLHPLLTLLLLGITRAAWRTLAERGLPAALEARPVLLAGTLEEVSDALRALKGSRQWLPVGILSPVPGDKGKALQNIRVLGGAGDLQDVAANSGAAAVLVASPPGSALRRELLLQLNGSAISLLTLPRADEWLRAEGTAGPRRIELEDLLGRDPVQLDVRGLAGMLSGQTVLVTGAGGSIGSELCRQIARFGVQKLVCVDVSEFAVYQLEQELREAHPQMQGLYYTANVREAERLAAIASAHKPSVVFHAAAYKHVPLMEELNEIEALRTNVLGTLNAARVAGRCGARHFVQVSTDKAVNPTNIMGASKRLAELVVQGVAHSFPQTQYVSVRFGNVLGSSGSVVPLFTQQIARGGPVTVTHPEIVRYFMTIPEAAQLVLQAGLMGRSGQIFVLDMGEPVRIAELAKMLIHLHGKTEQDIPVVYTGLRPGEKLFEELLVDGETTEPTPHPKLHIAKNSGAPGPDIDAVMTWIAEAGPAPSSAAIRQWLRTQVLEYAAR